MCVSKSLMGSSSMLDQAELFAASRLSEGQGSQAGLVVTRAPAASAGRRTLPAQPGRSTPPGHDVPRNAILARNLGQLTESIQSLPRHITACS